MFLRQVGIVHWPRERLKMEVKMSASSLAHALKVCPGMLFLLLLSYVGYSSSVLHIPGLMRSIVEGEGLGGLCVREPRICKRC